MAKKIKVFCGIPTEGNTQSEAYGNRLDMYFHLGRLAEKSNFEFYRGTIGNVFVRLAREKLCEMAVKIGADYIWMTDDDMLCPEDLFERLYRHDVDIVAPLAFQRREPYYPVIYIHREGWDAIRGTSYMTNEIVKNYPKNTLFECDAVGFGSVLIKTWVLKAMKEPRFEDSSTGEDIHFCTPQGIIYGDFIDIKNKPKEAITHTGIKQEVIDKYERNYKGELIRIKPKYCEEILLTPNHKIFEGKERWDKGKHNQSWKEAKDYKTGDYVFCPIPKYNDFEYTINFYEYCNGAKIIDNYCFYNRTTKHASKIPLNVKVDDDLAYVFGLYIAEGNSTNNNICFSFNRKEHNYINIVKKVFSEKFNINKYYESTKNNGYCITFTNKILTRFFKDNFGHGAKNKKIPLWLCENIKYTKQVIKGIYNGDGGLAGRVPKLTTSSRILAHQYRYMLLINNIFPIICKRTNNSYSVNVRATNRKKFGELIGEKYKDINNIYHNRFNYTIRKIKINDIEGWRVPLEKINREYFEGKVYNIATKNNHSYLLNGIAVHNCFSSKKLGARVYVDTSTEILHLGAPKIIGEKEYEEHNKIKDVRSQNPYYNHDYWRDEQGDWQKHNIDIKNGKRVKNA